MNDFDIDFDKTVFIVDDVTTALMVAIIASDNEIHCIVEAKEGCYDASLLAVIELLLVEVKFKSRCTYHVPSPFFLVNKRKPFNTLKNLHIFRKGLKKVTIYDDKIYVGAKTSSILCKIRSDKKKYYMDHGTGDYFGRILAKKNASLASTLMQYAYNLLGIPHHYYGRNAKGFTMCSIIDDTFSHVDYRNFHSNMVKDILSRLIETTSLNPKNTFFLAESDWHSSSGMDGDTTLYNKLNIEMIEKNVSKDETLFLKFHPTVGLADEIKIDLKEKLSARGYRVYNVIDFFEDKIGFYIPAEIIVTYCNISKIVCSESSVLWNVLHNPEITVRAEAKLLEKYFPKKIKSIYIELINQCVSRKIHP